MAEETGGLTPLVKVVVAVIVVAGLLHASSLS